MIIQLREYESGEYGLAEAVGEIKELRQQRRVRDRHIEELVQASNKLQAEASQLEEQNMALRYLFVSLFSFSVSNHIRNVI
jgi:cell division protein FtsB